MSSEGRELRVQKRRAGIARTVVPLPIRLRPASIHSRPVKAFRRLLFVAGIAGLVGLYAKLRGKDGVPPTSGGWRELEGPDFR